MGLGWGNFDTTIDFDKDREVDVEMSTVSLAGGWLINETWTIRAGFGVILDGEIKTPDGSVHQVDPGGLVSAGVERRLRVGEGLTPFIDLSLFLGASWTKTIAPSTQTKTDYLATDLRLGVRAGWNVSGKFFPYAAARVFGGPVSWEMGTEDVTGTDVNHYQLALGSAVPLGPVALYAEWAGLGEKAISVGASTSW